MSEASPLLRRPRRAAWSIACLVAATGIALLSASTASADSASDTSQFDVTGGALLFSAAPDVPALGTLALNGQAQTTTAQMSNWTVNDATGSGSGWRVTVQGDDSAGSSAVFKEYCTDADVINGCDTAVGGSPGPGYVTASPKTLAANSLALGSIGAGFTPQNGTTGTPPAHSCASSCNVDSASAVTIAAAAVDAGMGTYQADSYGPSSLSLSAPTTVKVIGTGNKVYRVDLAWTLASGPS